MKKRGSIFMPSTGATVPLRVRDKDGTVVVEGVSGKEIEVAEGCYRVGAILADGLEVLLDELVEVVAGQTVSAPPVDVERQNPLARQPDDDSQPQAVSARRWRGDWLASFSEQPTGLNPGAEGFIDGAITLAANEPTIIERDFDRDDLLVIEGSRGLNIHVLPLDRCLFGKEVSGERVAIGVECKAMLDRFELKYSSPVDPATNAFLEYVDNALLSESSAISADFVERSQHAIQSERSSLLCAVLSAYVLLRANQLEGLDRWTQQLVELVPDMPDAFALHMETLARMGNHGKAVEALRSGLGKGCPWFRSGLSYSLERLRLYIDVHSEQNSFRLSDEDLANFKKRKTQIERAAINLDTTALFTTFTSQAR